MAQRQSHLQSTGRCRGQFNVSYVAFFFQEKNVQDIKQIFPGLKVEKNSQKIERVIKVVPFKPAGFTDK